MGYTLSGCVARLEDMLTLKPKIKAVKALETKSKNQVNVRKISSAYAH